MTVLEYEERHEKAIALSQIKPKKDKGEVLKYTPVMSRLPTDFANDGYRCRFMRDDLSIFIVITMYNEGKDELERTLRGVCENLRSFIGREDKEDIWKRIVCCIVSDGRKVASQDTLDYATEIGIFSQEKVNEQVAKDDSVGVHLFETTVELTDHESLGTKFPPLQMMYALKEQNGGKIDSHWWFFEAFGNQLQPEYCFLLDVGTRPRAKALYFLWESMRRNPQIGGCCGEITTMKPFNINPLVQSQFLEYKVANFLDKTTESLLGYISVLPGAFSAYRFRALQGGPLEKYFHHIATPMGKLTPFEANQYLAEDRILCFELVAKKESNFTLHYDRRAVAETDSPTDLIDLIKQRRRWLNGSLFATIYAVMNLLRLLKESRHSIFRKSVFLWQFGLQAFVLLLTWLLVANFYLTFYFSAQLALESDIPFHVLRYVFLALTITQFVLGLGNRPQSVEGLYNVCCFMWGMFFIFTAALSLTVLFKDDVDVKILYGFILSSGLVLAAAALHGELWALVSSGLQYMFFAPTFLLIFPIYSICNLHDISWGTKGVDAGVLAKETKTEEIKADADVDERVRAKLRRLERIKKAEKNEKIALQLRFQHFRSVVLLSWMLSQGLYIGLLTLWHTEIGSDEGNNTVAIFFLSAMFAIAAFFNTFRFLCTLGYLFLHICTRKRKAPAYPTMKSVESSDETV